MQGLSTIITFYNGLSSLKMCINLLQDALKAEDIYEIIVVNDNPTMNINFLEDEYSVQVLNMPVNDCYMMVCHIILWCISFVDTDFMGQEVFCDSFLAFAVTHILFISEDKQHCVCPPDAAPHCFLPHRIEFLGDGSCGYTAHIAFKNVSNNLCLLRVDDPFPVLSLVISQHPA